MALSAGGAVARHLAQPRPGLLRGVFGL